MAARRQPQPLGAEKLRRVCDPARFRFSSTASLRPPKSLLGQDRAIEAIELACDIEHDGFHLFVLGAPGCGMQDAVLRLLERKARELPAPCDWIYVFNFEAHDKPNAICLPPGRGNAFRDAMETMIEDLRSIARSLFESEEYQNRRRNLEEGFKQTQDSAFQNLQKKAESQGTTIVQTPAGFAVAPTKNGEVIKPEQFKALGKAEKEKIERTLTEIQRELQDVLQAVPKMMTEVRRAVRDLDREYAQIAIGQAIGDVTEAFGGTAEVATYLEAVREDLAKNIHAFLVTPEMMQQEGGPGPMQGGAPGGEVQLRRYKVNVVVSSPKGTNGKGAPIVRDENPALGSVVGRIEHISQMGALVTDFTLIKPGSLHRANGGFLLVDARKVLMQPFAWEALKRALKNRHVKIETAAEFAGAFSTMSLDPEPIPLDIKVVLFGDHMLYYMLSTKEPEFAEYFKVEAEFNEVLTRNRSAEPQYAAWLAEVARCAGVRPLDPSGVGAVIDHSARMVSDSERLSLQSDVLSDLMREADHWARKDGAELIDSTHVATAIAGRRRRADRMRERQMEAIEREIVMVDTSGTTIGQINGLSVLQIADYSFGKPSRVTASVRMGTGQVVDIEREVELGGPLHSKGVLILSAYIAAHYTKDIPLAFAASLVFEQSYGGVDGDSASSTELYALLSALSGVPIKQSFAVTGSVNQHGQVQAIGGANQKIEGFFDLCASRGLTGKQGVMIPASNVQHLMLREDVVEACEAGRFAIYPVSTIDQGIELLTGVAAGERASDGGYPAGTINRLVEDRLIGLAEARRDFMKGTGGMEGQAYG